MTEPEDFLTRWSRRKREARAEPADQPKRDPAAASDAAEQEPQTQQLPSQSEDAKPEDVFDLSKLPSLDSIGPATDIRLFLQPGVPAALSRAALRRAWSADPAIRDFIGLSENSWDFTDPEGMHGFGALDPSDAKRLFAQLFGSESDAKDTTTSQADARVPAEEAEPARAAEPGHGDAPELESGALEHQDASGVSQIAAGDPMLRSSNREEMAVAPQKEQRDAPRNAEPIRRGHGRALPQ